MFYFDVYDGTHEFTDAFGIALESLEDVPKEAESLLRLLAYEQKFNPVPKVLKTLVRNEEGHNIYRGTIVTGKGTILFSGYRV